MGQNQEEPRENPYSRTADSRSLGLEDVKSRFISRGFHLRGEKRRISGHRQLSETGTKAVGGRPESVEIDISGHPENHRHTESDEGLSEVNAGVATARSHSYND